MIPTEDVNYVRDPATHAVLNTNKTAYAMYKQQRDREKTVDKINQEISELKNEFSEIKTLLVQLLQNANINR